MITNWNALGTKKITFMGERDKIWIVVPVSEWRVNPLLTHHYEHCVVKTLSSWAKNKRVDLAHSFRPLTFWLLTPKFISSSSNLYWEPQTWTSLYSVSPFGCPLVTSKLHKPKTKFILSSPIPKLGPSEAHPIICFSACSSSLYCSHVHHVHHLSGQFLLNLQNLVSLNIVSSRKWFLTT